MKKENNTASEILAEMKNSHSPICCIDSRLDYDAFCSALTLKLFLKDLGKNLRLTYLSTLPEDFKNTLSEITDISDIEFNMDPTLIDFSKHNLVLILDCGNINHLSSSIEFNFPENIRKINIDHHYDGNEFFGDLNYVFKVASTCSILYKFFDNLGIKTNETIQKLLVTGITTDSSFFQENSTSTEDLKITADLLEKLNMRLYDLVLKYLYSEKIESLKLKRIIYKNLTVDYKQKIAYSYVTMEDFTREALDPQTPFNFPITFQPADELRKIDGIDLAIFIREKEEPNTYSVSLRAHTMEYDVLAIAKEFGGGGHITGAGCLLKNVKTINEALQKILEAAEKVKPNHKV